MKQWFKNWIKKGVFLWSRDKALSLEATIYRVWDKLRGFVAARSNPLRARSCVHQFTSKHLFYDYFLCMFRKVIDQWVFYSQKKVLFKYFFPGVFIRVKN